MKPPKRSPFLHSRHTDLLSVYHALYPSASHPFSPQHRSSALSTVQLWINRSACPFAVEATALLVQSIILDETMQGLASRHHTGSTSLRRALEQMAGGAELGVRLNYSLAITRFVNSVVDSHQTGGFAQSIAAIAARIELPLWFVEIRHAATHEELPSIDVCRSAARAALEWLHGHFWWPQLFAAKDAQAGERREDMDVDRPASCSQAVGGASTSKADEQDEQEATRKKERRKALSDLRNTVGDYRTLAKRVTRDRSLVNKSKDEFRRLFKQMVGFVLRVRTLQPGFAAQLIDSAQKKGKEDEFDARGGSVATMDPDDVDECTKAGLAYLVDELLQPGGLIPLAKSKRVAEEGAVLPEEVARLWSPLLAYLRDTFGAVFGQILTEELVDLVVREAESTGEDEEEAGDGSSSQSWRGAAVASPGYRATAEAWIRYLVGTVPAADFASGLSARRSATTLIGDTEVAEMCLPFRSGRSTAILEHLCDRNEALKKKIGPLVSVLQVAAFVDDESLEAREDGEESGFERQLEVMQQRLADVQALVEEQREAVLEVEANEMVQEPREEQQQHDMPTGWRLADSSWKPTPFGCLEGKIPDLMV